MKTGVKVLVCFALSLMILCSYVGFAALSGSLTITGDAEVMPSDPEGLYISDVSIYRVNGVTVNEAKPVYPTNVQSSFNVNSQNGCSVTYKITVINDTDMTYWYLGTDALDDIGDNSLIGKTNGIFITTMDNYNSTSPDFNTLDWVPPRTERIFYATFEFGSNARGNISTLVNFKFGLHMGSISDEFLKVLNDKTSQYGYYYLADAFNENYADGEGTVIGNFGNDLDVFTNLFGPSLKINVDGVDVPVTIMVERRDVDGKAGTGDSYDSNGSPSGCEYTVYITVDDQKNADGKATVFAVSYTCGADGVWYMIGELYEGKCVQYDHDTSNTKFDSAFDVSTWLAVKKDYQVTDDITYKVGYEQGTNFDKLLTIDELMSVNDQEFYNKVNNNSGKLLKPVCNILYTYVHNNGQYVESVNNNNRYKPGYDALKEAFDKIKPYCLIANGAQEVKIQNANSLSRAELIQLLEAIQLAYDYYLEVNP